MTDVQVPQSRVLAVAERSVDLRVQQTRPLAVYNVPAEEVQVQQSRILNIFQRPVDLHVQQSRLLAVFSGRVADPRLQAWASQLDLHEQYYLRLGDALTLVYDTYSGEWSEYGHSNSPFWRVSHGTNWLGANSIATLHGSNIVIGDDVTNMLYFLDPAQPFDHPPFFDDEAPRYFTRHVMGQVALRGRETVPCYASWLTTNMGSPAYMGASVKLSISDDAGYTYYDMGDVEVRQGFHSPEIAWYSLGQITAPGRLFMFSDDGAVVRIDTMEMQDPPQSEDDDKK